MIGYYVHHQGRGHLHRATALASHLGDLTVLSSLPEPSDWPGSWVPLDRDDGDVTTAPEAVDVTAHGRLHWVPAGHDGLRSRMAAVSRWIESARPAAMVVDVSVEVALLARLHGVPVVVIAQPGDRLDPAHRLAHDVAAAILAPWPATSADAVQMSGDALERLVHVGALSRFDDRDREGPARSRTILVLDGTGGSGLDPSALDAARDATPDWTWTALGRDTWVEDPWPLLCRADVVLTHAGQNAVAEVAAARRPAVVVPAPRPHDEQAHLAAALAADGSLPVAVLDDLGALDPRHWSALLTSVSQLDGETWVHWNDGSAAERAAAVVDRVAS